jgi:hypothetical protein
MKGRKIKEKEGSSRGMYIRSTSDIPPKGKYIRNSYIPPNWNDMRSIADITKLGDIPMVKLGKVGKIWI